MWVFKTDFRLSLVTKREEKRVYDISSLNYDVTFSV